jgi:hypothetical protein
VLNMLGAAIWEQSEGDRVDFAVHVGVVGGKLRSGAIELVGSVLHRTGKDRIASSYSAETSARARSR